MCIIMCSAIWWHSVEECNRYTIRCSSLRTTGYSLDTFVRKLSFFLIIALYRKRVLPLATPLQHKKGKTIIMVCLVLNLCHTVRQQGSKEATTTHIFFSCLQCALQAYKSKTCLPKTIPLQEEGSSNSFIANTSQKL